MEEIGIEISHHRSKSLFEFFDTDIDIIITACNGAKAVCPGLSGTRRTIHQGFTNTSTVTGSDEVKLAIFRTFRGEITQLIYDIGNPGGALTWLFHISNFIEIAPQFYSDSFEDRDSQ